MSFNVDGRVYPLTVEEAWALRSHLPELPDDPLGGPSTSVAVRLEQLVHEADGLRDPSPTMPVFHDEKIVLRLALDRWLHAVKASAFPQRAFDLRDALFIEDLGALAFRDVVLRFADGREEHQQDVLVTGDPFEHEGRWWVPQSWRRLYGIDEVDGQLLSWLVCSEIEGYDSAS